MEYKIVEERGAPTYYDIETGKVLYESGEDGLMSYWVVLYNTEEQDIEEFIETFPNEQKAKEYMAKLIAEDEAKDNLNKIAEEM